MRKKERKKREKKKSAPPLRISGFATVRDHILQEDRIKAIIEELSGFLLDEVIDPKGEFHDDDCNIPENSPK